MLNESPMDGTFISNSMHYVENILMLTMDHYADLIPRAASSLERVAISLSEALVSATIIMLKYPCTIRLGDIQNVNLIPGKISTYLSNNTNGVISYYCDNWFFS